MDKAAPADGLRVLGVDARSGRRLAPLPLEIANQRATGWLPRARPPRYGVRSDRLDSAGWGVVFSENADPLALEALEPLLRRRRRAAGERYVELTVRRDATATSFRGALHAAHGRVEPRQAPWYLMLVGDADHLSFGLEHDLGPAHAMGRLPFNDPENLAAYAERLDNPTAHAERGHQLEAAVFAPMHKDDVPTKLCIEHFAKPLASAAATHLDGRPRPNVTIHRAFGAGATRQRLSEIIRAAPNLLVTGTHGLFYLPTQPSQRTLQGSLVCADWPGEPEDPAASRPIYLSESFTAGDLPTNALPGGIALMLGCFTAGTPRYDLFDSIDPEERQEQATRPFVSAIARRLLGRNGGAKAVIGHVGRAYEAGFYWRGVAQSAALEDTVRALLDGRRAGEALDGMGQRHADVAVAWARPQTDIDTPDPDPLDLWIALNDARAWSLLGDPAVRLTSRPA